MGLLVGNRVGGNGSKNRGAGGGLVSVKNKVCCIQHREVSGEGKEDKGQRDRIGRGSKHRRFCSFNRTQCWLTVIQASHVI